MVSKAQQERARQYAFWSIIVALLVMGIKFLAWWLTGSVALYSDALESIVNVIASSVALAAVRFSQRPADDTHQFGHHKAEYLSAVLEGVLIVVAALLIINEAWQVFINPREIDQPWLGMAVNFVAGVLNLIWAVLLLRAARELGSPALDADARHILSDVVTSFGVLAGLLAVVVTGWAIFDPLMALVVAVNILWQGWKILARSTNALLDHALLPEQQELIGQTIARNSKGAIEFHDLKTREAGSVRFAEFHLIVPAMMTVTASHEICDRIETALQGVMPGLHVTIHVEPEEKRKPHEGVAL